MNGIAVLGDQDGGCSLPGGRYGSGVAGPVLGLNAMEGLLVFRVGDALRVDGRVSLSWRLRLAPAALVDHWDGYVTCLETCAAGPRRLVLRDSVNLKRNAIINTY